MSYDKLDSERDLKKIRSGKLTSFVNLMKFAVLIRFSKVNNYELRILELSFKICHFLKQSYQLTISESLFYGQL